MGEFVQAQDESIKVKKTYQKPQVERVQLTLEESILGVGCKVNGQAGPTINGCFRTGIQPCNARVS